MTPEDIILEEVFKAFETSGISYAVLRNYDGLPFRYSAAVT